MNSQFNIGGSKKSPHAGTRFSNRVPACPVRSLRRLVIPLLVGFILLLTDPGLLAELDPCYGSFDPATMAVDSRTMLVSGLHANRHVVTGSPEFSWTVATGVRQRNWQIQIDSAPDFNGHAGEIWFWDSGQGGKAGLEASSRSIPIGGTSAPGISPRSIDTRASLIYWRIRIQEGEIWSGWSCSFFKRNQVPLGNETMIAVPDPSPGMIPSQSNYPAPARSRRSFYVSPSGSDTNSGSPESPFKTIGRGARALGPGETLIVKNGIYNQNIKLRSGANGGAMSGEPGSPIIIRAENPGGAVLRGVRSGPMPWIPLDLVGVDYWIVDGLKIGGAGAAVGVQVTRGEFVTIRHISFESNFNTNGIGVRLWGGGRGNRVLDSVFDTRMFDQVEVLGSRHPEIRGNEFTKVDGHVAIHYHNSGSQGGTISDNIFHDFSSTEGAIFLYMAADGTTVRNNVVYGVREGHQGFAAGVLIMRCGKILVENNTIVRTPRGIAFLEYSRYNVVRNNILVGNTTALDFSATRSAEPGATALGTIFENNLTFKNGQDLVLFHPSDKELITLTNNRFDVDPQFVKLDPLSTSPYAASNLHLRSSSPARDSGKMGIPVPIGGGGTIDIGALEFGAQVEPPYEYQPAVPTIHDSTPKFTFGYIDRDLDLALFNPLAVPDTTREYQVGIELEIDISNRFDSVGGNRPIFSTGPMAPHFAGAYTIPDTDALEPGLYYVRVRQRDGNQGFYEAGWSSNNFRIRIGGERAQ
jgi:parallel beta-helix repeat protein